MLNRNLANVSAKCLPVWWQEPKLLIEQSQLMPFMLDQQMLGVDEHVRCWFCYQRSWSWWDNNLIQCVGYNACKTHYVLFPLKDGPISPYAKRHHCVHCRAPYVNLKGTAWRCWRCRRVTHMPALTSMIVLIEPEIRKMHRSNGDLKLEGGPAWSRFKTAGPWKPRVDLPRKEFLNRQRKYRNMEIKKINAGRDPQLDYRRLREVW